MKIYMAGKYENGLASYMLDKSFMYRGFYKKHFVKTPILASYHYIQSGAIIPAIEALEDRIFLDSGAYSMFTLGVKVDFKAYAEFIKRYSHVICAASNMDYIGASSEQLTWDNQRRLEDLGVKVHPVHHARDDDKWLQFYIDKGYKYILLGGMVPESTKYLTQWLDRVWGNILTDDKGKPLVKVHGFGLTGDALMRRYPWYSVDSTTWLMVASFGAIILYMNDRLLTIHISAHAPSRKTLNNHYTTLTLPEKKKVKQYIKSRGFTISSLKENYMARRLLNVQTFKEMSTAVKWKKRFKHTHKGLFT